MGKQIICVAVTGLWLFACSANPTNGADSDVLTEADAQAPDTSHTDNPFAPTQAVPVSSSLEIATDNNTLPSQSEPLSAQLAESPNADAKAMATTQELGETFNPIPKRSRMAAKVARYLVGKYDSSTQSQVNSTYANISLTVCRVAAPQYGDNALYVEQAQSRTPTLPFYQRLYVINETLDDDAVAVNVYKPNNPTLWRGACDKETIITVPTGAFIPKVGCALYMTATKTGFIGSTKGIGCASSLKGARYSTSEVGITETDLSSWVQGFSAENVRVWGAMSGPYVFVRKTTLLSDSDWIATIP